MTVVTGWAQRCPHCKQAVHVKVKAGVNFVNQTEKSVSYSMVVGCPKCKKVIARINHIATRVDDRLEQCQ